MDWHQRNTTSFASDLDRFCFEPTTNTVVQCYQYLNSDQIHCEVQRLTDHMLRLWLKKSPDHSSAGTPIRAMRIIISRRASDACFGADDPGAETLSHLPFSRETFLEIMDHLHLSPSFIRTVLKGVLHYSSNILTGGPSSHSFKCFNMRMENSWPRDLAMSASTNIETGITYALFHGCDEQDLKVLTDWIHMTTCSVGHPLLLPALFAEMQLRRHKKYAWDSWSSLVTLYDYTGHYGTGASNLQTSSSQDNSIDYDKTTRDVLEIYQSTGFLERDLVRFCRSLKQMASQLPKLDDTATQAWKTLISAESIRIGDRLDEMIGMYFHSLSPLFHVIRRVASDWWSHELGAGYVNS